MLCESCGALVINAAGCDACREPPNVGTWLAIVHWYPNWLHWSKFINCQLARMDGWVVRSVYLAMEIVFFNKPTIPCDSPSVGLCTRADVRILLTRWSNDMTEPRCLEKCSWACPTEGPVLYYNRNTVLTAEC